MYVCISGSAAKVWKAGGCEHGGVDVNGICVRG